MTAPRPTHREVRGKGTLTGWLMLALLAAPAWAVAANAVERPLPAGAIATGFDPDHTRFGFELRTRWGQRVAGTFPRYDGELVELPDGRQQVRIRLATAAVEVGGSPRYTDLARGARFFDAQHHPLVEFVSDPHPPALARTGGPLRGQLTMRGVSRTETFMLEPSDCARPGRDCDAVASGSVDRGDYALDDWRFVLGDTVRFQLRVRLQQPAQGASR